jgi:hypothetical protein
VDLVDEEHLLGLEVHQDVDEIAGTLEHRSRRRLEGYLHLLGDDRGQGGLAEAGRPEEEDVVEGLRALLRRLDEDAEVVDDALLPDILGEAPRPDRRFGLDVFAGGARGQGLARGRRAARRLRWRARD